MRYEEMDDEQARQIINAEQAFHAYQAAREALKRRYAGSMAWKTVGGRVYLYRARRGVWKALGPRNENTEAVYERFRTGRAQARLRAAVLSKRLDRTAAVSRALNLGRIPRIAARILRALSEAGMSEPITVTVGTNALFAYERLAGVKISDAVLETNDIDLLYDARTSLKILAPEDAVSGVAGILRKVDSSFEILGAKGFRAANRDGYIVDLIAPLPRDPMRPRPPVRVGSDPDDLIAAEIEGLAWLVNSPKTTVTVIDTRGYPSPLVAPDPRAFALHKAWLAERPDRDRMKRQRDRAQAELVAALIAERLLHLSFDDPALGALPIALRAQAASLLPRTGCDGEGSEIPEPDW